MISTFVAEPQHSVGIESINEAISFVRQLARPVLLTRVECLPSAPDPIAFLATGSLELGGGVLWQQPNTGVTFAGAGSALQIRASGPGRFGHVSESMRDVSQTLVRDDDGLPFPAIGGFTFSDCAENTATWRDFPDGMLVIPEILLQLHGGDAFLRITVQVNPGSSPLSVERRLHEIFRRGHDWANTPLQVFHDQTAERRFSLPERSVWESSVATAVAMIQQGTIDKVVLAREERLLADRPISPFFALSRLRQFDSSATLFAMQSGASWFVGATPERLVRLQNGHVDVTCLAGSVGIGTDEVARHRLAAQLLASEKDREEHEIVVRSTAAALAEVCENVVRLPGTPRIATARSVQHLESPLTADLSCAGNILDLVERLHPTPAVGGHPRDCALSIIRELEEIDRGWYAAPFGWMDLDGSGEFAVAIRSAVLTGTTASLFAGCGIVAASDPATEYEETCLKLQPMLSALGAA